MKILDRSRPGLLAIALLAVTVSGVFVLSGSPASSATVVTPTLDFGDLELRFNCPVSGETTFRYRPSERPAGNTTGIVVAKPAFVKDCEGGTVETAIRARGVVSPSGALVSEDWGLTPLHFGHVKLEIDRWVEYRTGPNSLIIIYSDREPAAYTLDPATQEVTGTTGVALVTSPLTPTGFGAAPTFSTSGLPDGLGIDPATGVISGIPTATFGPQSITVTATNGDEEATAAVNITIESPKFTVTFNQDVGMLTRVVTVDEGQPIVLPKTQNSSGQEGVTLSGGGSALFPVVKDSHLFGGWYSDASYAEGSFVGLPGATITPAADLTLYARWIPARDICFAQATSTVDAAVTFPAAWVTQWSMGYPTRSCTFGTSPGTRVRVPSDAPFELPVPTRANAGFHGVNGR